MLREQDMPLINKFFENPDEWTSAFSQRSTEYEALVEQHRTRRKLFDTEREGALQQLISAFSDEISTSESLLAEVAPISPDEIAGIPGRRAAYSDRMAVLMAKMAMLAYINFEDKDKSRILVNTLQHGAIKLVEAAAVNDTEVFIAEAANFVVVAFRGTTSKLDRKTDTTLTVDRIQVVGHPKKVHVHSGFYAAYLGVEDLLRQTLFKIEKKPIYLTGHSLGGAVALVASAALGGHDTLGERVAAVYTFGSPRVGGPEFPYVVKAPHYRIVNSGDAVPLVPPNWLRGYRHTGTPIMLRKGVMRPVMKAQIGSAFYLGVFSILLWPLTHRLLFRAAHDISLYASRLDQIARYRGSWS
jgi:triacylglycerol lipase